MNKVFLTKDKVEIKSGYLSVVGKEMNPVSNPEFIAAQKLAHYTIIFAEKAKNKDFKGKKVDSLIDLQNEVARELQAKVPTYVETPKAPSQKLTKQLVNEALAFMNTTEETEKVAKINAALQKFNVINKFETVGLFFEPEIVEIEKIYTMGEIIEAVKSTVDLI